MQPLAYTFSQTSLDCNGFVTGSIHFFIFLENFNSVLNLPATSLLATAWLNASNLGSAQQTEWNLKVLILNATLGEGHFMQKF